ncbi:MAG TPA: hybrid sensor histidine kinase/response regulator [Steroidobacteraceae bacterium]
MDNSSAGLDEFEAGVAKRFGLVPNFFRSSEAAPELIQQLWGFATAAYLDNPMPSLFKERLFVWLSRFCPVRYCIIRHVGFLLGHGHPAGDGTVVPQTVDEILRLLMRPTPWQRNMDDVYTRLGALSGPAQAWPEAGTELEDIVFACAAIIFVEPARSERARLSLVHAVGPRQFEFFCGCLAFIRTAHYWTLLHPEIEAEDDIRLLLSQHKELETLLLHDPEADRAEMGQRLFGELTGLRDLHERAELEKAKQALEEKDRQKDQFIAVLGHELRNPLAAIRSAIDAMGLLELNDPRVRLLRDRVDRQATAMKRMLDDLLDASRVTLGKVTFSTGPVDLLELLGDAMDELEPRLRDAGLRLETQLTGEPCMVRGDRVRLQQIVDNLLSNAVKFTPAEGVVTLNVATDGDAAILTIKDTGIGFDNAFASKLFEPFTQSEMGLDRSGGGLGLGLAIASRLAALQGGSLSAESPGPGQGASFTLRVPRDSSVAFVPTARHATSFGSQRRSILLVEDNRDTADSLAELLGLAGFQVAIAYDGAMAVKSALGVTPDFVVCDLGLPGAMDGYAVAQAFRAEPALRSVRLLATSGYSGDEFSARAIDAGFECLLTKPLNFDVLERLVMSTRVADHRSG